MAGERLLIHSVQDDTALRSYLPAARRFAEFCLAYSLPVHPWSAMDDSLVQFFAHVCYVEDKHPLNAELVMNALAYIYPEGSRHLPKGWRAAQAFGKLSITKSGGPVGLETLACMEQWLREQKGRTAEAAADQIVISVDGYLREQDAAGLRAKHLSWAHDGLSVAAAFGLRESMLRSKTGWDQGVVFDEPYSLLVLRRRVKGLEPDGRVFPLSSSVYGRWWRAAARAVLGDPGGAGPPHTARHTGASRDMSEGRRTFEEVKRRGRWKSDDSVQRYARPHAWLEAVAAQPPEVYARGRAILDEREKATPA